MKQRMNKVFLSTFLNRYELLLSNEKKNSLLKLINFQIHKIILVHSNFVIIRRSWPRYSHPFPAWFCSFSQRRRVLWFLKIQFVICMFVNCLCLDSRTKDWLIDWLNEWLIELLMEWLIDGLIEWLNDWWN